MRHFAKADLTLLVLIIVTGAFCQKIAAPAQPVATPRSETTASSAVLPTLAGRHFYVAPAGSPDGDGSLGSPWDLATALGQPAVQPGDKIWLRGGTYPGTYTSWLTGTAAAPIVVRQYPGERAIIDGRNSNGAGIITVAGSYTWFWGFEVMSSYGNRVSTQSGSGATDILYGSGVITEQAGSHPGLKFINMIVHDTRQGFSFWKEATDSEIYGCLIYYNGWNAPDRGHGHGIYTQNQVGIKTIKDNIIFANYDHGIHAYGSSSAYLNNLWVEGNTLSQNGDLSVGGGGRNLLIGGGSVAQNPTVTSNYLYRYYDGHQPSSDLDLGYGAGCSHPKVTNNYVADWTYFVNCTTGLTMTGNTFYGSISGFSPSSFPNNTYLSQRPTATVAFVRPNQYEPGRANVTVYNWSLASTISVNLSGILAVGQGYEVRNAQNFFGPPVHSGIYNGGVVSLPMTGLSVATPVGLPAPTLTGPEFAVFVVLPVASAGSPTPKPPPADREQDPHANSETSADRIEARRVIACAGLQSDRVAAISGQAAFRIVPFRGE